MNINLLDLLDQNGCRLRKVANTKGGEYAGACPFCGGDDRFRVWSETGRYWCRQCDKNGDAIQFVRDTKNMGYREACNYLDIDAKNYQTGKWQKMAKTDLPEWKPRKTDSPINQWQEKAKAFLEYTQKKLWSDSCANIRNWLHTARGLTDETIRKAGLGFNPKEFYRKRELWGFEPQINEKTGKPKSLWLPVGLVIPCFSKEKNIVRLRIRTGKKDYPYLFVSGGDSRCMVLSDDKSVCIVVESELDALLINQEGYDMVNVIALGNAQIKPDMVTHELLRKANLILCSLDYDDAGATSALNWWEKKYPQLKIWFPIESKDPGEMYQKGEYPIRLWIEAGLTDEIPPEPDIIPEAVQIDKYCRDCEAFVHGWCFSYFVFEHIKGGDAVKRDDNAPACERFREKESIQSPVIETIQPKTFQSEVINE